MHDLFLSPPGFRAGLPVLCGVPAPRWSEGPPVEGGPVAGAARGGDQAEVPARIPEQDCNGIAGVKDGCNSHRRTR